ncbi:MAG: SAF domain-containing protein [Micropruina sp.]|uniref:SAF domain-containing protein n=1 Tax=Micropruina sp. TaxID=2737536 RepID=UPI0039E67D52
MRSFRPRLRRLARRYRRVAAALMAGVAVWAALSVLRPAGPPTTAVLVAERALVGGQTIAAGDIAVRQIPTDALPAEYLDEPDQAVGRPLTVSLPPGAVLLPTSVVTKAALAAPGLAVLPVTLTATAVGLVEVGDRIDLLGSDSDTDTALVASAARVVAVLTGSKDSSPLSPVSTSGPVVLVEVRPAALPAIAAAASRGPLGFGLR